VYLITDYMPSDGVSVSVLKPTQLKPGLVKLCQELVQKEADWKFWIRLSMDFPDPRHHGHSENIRVRSDRIVHDYDARRLAAEFPNQIPLLA